MCFKDKALAATCNGMKLSTQEDTFNSFPLVMSASDNTKEPSNSGCSSQAWGFVTWHQGALAAEAFRESGAYPVLLLAS